LKRCPRRFEEKGDILLLSKENQNVPFLPSSKGEDKNNKKAHAL